MTRVLATDCYQLGFGRKDGAVRIREGGAAVGTPIGSGSGLSGSRQWLGTHAAYRMLVGGGLAALGGNIPI